MRSLLKQLPLLLVALTLTVAVVQCQDQDFVVEQFNQLIPIDPDQRVWELTEVTSEDMYYINGRMRRQAVIVPSIQVPYIQRLMPLADEQKGLTANLPTNAANLTEGGRPLRLEQIVAANYWNRIIKRATEGRFSDASRIVLHMFSTDETIFTVWPWAREIGRASCRERV